MILLLQIQLRYINIYFMFSKNEKTRKSSYKTTFSFCVG